MKIKYSEIIKNQPTTNLGMIGHVAHGKSTLAFQITGTKTQKFASEKERNITIHIGYANAKIFKDNEGKLHTASSDTNSLTDKFGNEMSLIKHISIVDCPGHESFMSNMINGSAVMDACVLVIAANDPIPQPQTYEHLQAVESIDIDKFIILQNKMDLIHSEENDQKLGDIKNFLKHTKASKSQIIPTSVQSGVNVEEVIKSISKFPNFERRVNDPARLIVIRSFDINRPNTNYKKMNGGIIGGSLVSGMLKKGDIIEIRPGFIMSDKDGNQQYRPIISRVESLQSDTRQLEYAFPGGLIGVKLNLDPSLTKNNGMVGQVMGHIGTLPPVYTGLKFNYELINRYDNLDVSFKKGENIIICANAMRIEASIATYKKKKKQMRVLLKKPICLDMTDKIAIFKNVNMAWKLVATAKADMGLECKKLESETELYNELYNENKNREKIEIEYDVDIYESEEVNYTDLLDNITFRDFKNYNINVRPPVIKYVYPISTLVNFSDICRSLNMTPKDKPSENYNDLLSKYFKKELSCEGDFNGSKQLGLRGRFNNQSIEGVLVNFINIYLKCFSCKSPRTYLSKINKKLYKNCLTCNSISCVNL